LGEIDMKSFLRENPTIAFGLGLPLLLVIVFLLISGLPTLLVAAPQYDVLLSDGYYNNRIGVQISVVGRKVQVFYQGHLHGDRIPRLWRYDPKTGGVKEIAIVLPPPVAPSGEKPDAAEEVTKRTRIEVPDLEGLTVDSSSIAPDGYAFSVANGRYSGGLFGGLFYSSRYRHEAVLRKNGRVIRLPNSFGRYFSGNSHFIGWVVSP